MKYLSAHSFLIPKSKYRHIPIHIQTTEVKLQTNLKWLKVMISFTKANQKWSMSVKIALHRLTRNGRQPSIKLWKAQQPYPGAISGIDYRITIEFTIL